MVELSSVLAGGIAGACGILVGHPFDSLKVRVQVGKTVPIAQFDIHTVKQLYRGVLPPLLTTGIIQAINFTLYEHFKKSIHRTVNNGLPFLPNQQYSLSTTFWGGTLAGACISTLTIPIGIVKIQLQLNSESGTIACAKDLYQKSGFRVFYRGYLCSFILEAPGRGIYLWTYEAAKMKICSSFGYDLNNAKAPFFATVGAGVCAGMFSWLIVYPADVIKSKMQSDVHRRKFASIWQCTSQTWQKGGIRSMYRGLGYTLLRAGPVAASILPMYDLCKAYIDSELLALEYS
jgi:solute carrier family 25 carnitine/acylcarnitine transporter 20/29